MVVRCMADAMHLGKQSYKMSDRFYDESLYKISIGTKNASVAKHFDMQMIM